MKRALLLLLSLAAVCPASDAILSSAHRFDDRLTLGLRVTRDVADT